MFKNYNLPYKLATNVRCNGMETVQVISMRRILASSALILMH